MRGTVFGLLGMLLAATPAAQAQGESVSPLPATAVTSADIHAFLEALPSNAISDSPIRVVDVGGHRIGVFGVFRPKSLPSDAIVHETRTTEVYYMLEGSATLVTGGTATEPRPSRGTPESTTKRFTKIVGGATRHVVPGDIIIIPGRTAHWWSSLDGDSIRYLIVRSDPDNGMTLK